MRRFIIVVGALGVLGAAVPASAQMNEPEWIDDINWHANLGTGVALETGPDPAPLDVQERDPFLLYFGGDVRKSWRWWYGLTFDGKVDLYTDLADYPMVPYKLLASSSFGLGPPVFRMEIARAEMRTEPFGWIDDGAFHSTGTRLRLQLSTLPTFTGDVKIDDGRHILTYFAAPLAVVIGTYDTEVQPGIHDTLVAHVPYTAGKFRIQDRIILTPWAQLRGALELQKAWANPEIRFIMEFSAIIGILENAVQFSLDIEHDHWKTPGGFTENLATFTLAARLRI